MAHLFPVTDIQVLKKYDYIPETYINKVQDFNLFIPLSHQYAFHTKLYYNFLQRECFNSCIQTASSSSLSDEESSCFNNCRSKHLASLAIYEKVTMAKRRWNGMLDWVNLHEYHKRPEEMGHLVPTDIYLRSSLRTMVMLRRSLPIYEGTMNLLNMKFYHTPNQWDSYFNGIQPSTSNAFIRDNNPTVTLHRPIAEDFEFKPPGKSEAPAEATD